MFSAERIRKIKELLLEYQEVDVNTLCSCFSASVSTIRRDLDKLEEEGFLRRIHGGAVLVSHTERDAGNQMDAEAEESMAIAKLASKLIAPDDIIFLGGGRACCSIAQQIRSSFQGTIYTNNLDVVAALKDTSNINIILLGGRVVFYNNRLLTNTDPEFCNISNVFVDKFFFTVYGLTARHGYFASDVVHRQLIDTILRNSSSSYLLLENRKLNRMGTVRIGGIDTFPHVIASSTIPDDFKQLYYDNKITLYTSFADL